MSTRIAAALFLALISAILTNLAYSREHDAAAKLPVLSLRRPVHSLRLLVGDRSWMTGFLLESGGFGLYAAALALASLALVQSIGAGGIGVLAYLSARTAGRALSGRELCGVLASVLGLVALAVSLAGSSGQGDSGSTGAILLWLGATGLVVAAVLHFGPTLVGRATASGIAGGLMFSIGDISTKLATEGGARLAFLLTLVLGYTFGTGLLQAGYQVGGALTVAGVATLLTNALPIAAGTVLLGEPVPSGVLGVVRVLAFAAVILGSVLLSRPHPTAGRGAVGPAPSPAAERQ
jgi:hypothetical protein